MPHPPRETAPEARVDVPRVRPQGALCTLPCPSLAASTAAYRRRSFSDSHPKNRCIFCSISAEYPSMPHSLIQNLLRGQDTTAQAIREVILDHILSGADAAGHTDEGRLSCPALILLDFIG